MSAKRLCPLHQHQSAKGQQAACETSLQIPQTGSSLSPHCSMMQFSSVFHCTRHTALVSFVLRDCQASYRSYYGLELGSGSVVLPFPNTSLMALSLHIISRAGQFLCHSCSNKILQIIYTKKLPQNALIKGARAPHAGSSNAASSGVWLAP